MDILKFIAFNNSTIQFIHSSLNPILNTILIIGSLLSVFFLILGAYHYIVSSGNTNKLLRAKKIIYNSLIGLVILISALFINNLLINTSNFSSTNSNNHIPAIVNIKPKAASSGLVDIILKAISGVIANIISTIGSPFLKALSYFTSSTPLNSSNSAVFHLWLISSAIADGLIVLVIALIGLKIMSSSIFGFSELSIKQLFPQILLAFILINSSIFIIDYIISISNIMIQAISSKAIINNFWNILEKILTSTSGYSLAALLIMVVFIILSIILVIFYLGRLVTIYLGAVLAPIIILCALLPGLRDLAISAAKKYFVLIFVLFIHVVIIQLSASLLIQLINTSSKTNSNALMSAVLGLATILALLKTQGVMYQLSIASVAPKMARNISQKVLFNVSYVGNQLNRAVSGALPIINGTRSYYSQANYLNPPSRTPSSSVAKPDNKS